MVFYISMAWEVHVKMCECRYYCLLVIIVTPSSSIICMIRVSIWQFPTSIISFALKTKLKTLDLTAYFSCYSFSIWEGWTCVCAWRKTRFLMNKSVEFWCECAFKAQLFVWHSYLWVNVCCCCCCYCMSTNSIALYYSPRCF